MRSVDVKEIADAVAEMARESNYFLGEDVKCAIQKRAQEEPWPVAKSVLEKIEENIGIAEEGVFPLCQDTGLACVFLEIGQDVHLTGGFVEDAVNEGVRRGYRDGYLRRSVVRDPLRRINTGDNTPAHIHYEIVPGEQVKITFAAKGFGSENMSRIKMLPPSAGAKGVMDFIVKTCEEAGANPCPPIVVGVGIGGTFDKAALMAKEALLIPFDRPNPDAFYAEMEEKLLRRINVLGKKVVTISGMHCEHCVNNVTNAINRIDGASASVSLARGEAVVSYDREVDERQIARALEQAGYRVEKISGV